VIYRDGSVHEGRNVDYIGAHCAADGHNTYSIGVAYVGGVENRPGVPYERLKAKDTRTTAQKNALLRLLLDLVCLYPDAKIYGHRDFDKSKACPSFDAKAEYNKI
jgi:N-acetylmuramoyl-L-alanine amidase